MRKRIMVVLAAILLLETGFLLSASLLLPDRVVTTAQVSHVSDGKLP